MKIVERSSIGPYRGFSLIELMVTVAIVAILAAIALPSYYEYITRSRLVDAHTRLGDLRIQMEKYFQDNRTYLSRRGLRHRRPRSSPPPTPTPAAASTSRARPPRQPRTRSSPPAARPRA